MGVLYAFTLPNYVLWNDEEAVFAIKTAFGLMTMICCLIFTSPASFERCQVQTGTCESIFVVGAYVWKLELGGVQTLDEITAFHSFGLAARIVDAIDTTRLELGLQVGIIRVFDRLHEIKTQLLCPTDLLLV